MNLPGSLSSLSGLALGTPETPSHTELPSYAPYLRARYGDLSDQAIDDLTAYFEDLASREGVRLDGPQNGEDEAR